MNLSDMTRKFLLGEWKDSKVFNFKTSVQAIFEILDSLRMPSQRDQHKIQIVKEQLVKMRRENRKLTERLQVLEEQVKILEEGDK